MRTDAAAIGIRAVRWFAWSLLCAPLAALAVVYGVAISVMGPSRVVRNLVNYGWGDSSLTELLFVSLHFVPFLATAVLLWVLVATILPALDERLSFLVAAFPLLVASTLVAWSFLIGGANPGLDSLLAPWLVGCVAVLPRVLDPALRPGAFSARQDQAAV
jgi:hypothetical protein